ncbi:hypothetical protein Tcan_04904 [Toxocara canis]|uniref:Uncharacterized protein n=1 Tax=Toxocara canis TaxID=6265 RepID=A0A0B2VND0_TOXCA|nr:hypothetical protein Tcan_04904 [Toxocara canis]
MDGCRNKTILEAVLVNSDRRAPANTLASAKGFSLIFFSGSPKRQQKPPEEFGSTKHIFSTTGYLRNSSLSKKLRSNGSPKRQQKPPEEFGSTKHIFSTTGYLRNSSLSKKLRTKKRCMGIQGTDNSDLCRSNGLMNGSKAKVGKLDNHRKQGWLRRRRMNRQPPHGYCAAWSWLVPESGERRFKRNETSAISDIAFFGHIQINARDRL